MPTGRREGGLVTGLAEPGGSWRKSIASGVSDCAEVAAAGGLVLIRDSADRDGAVLRVPPAAWSAFLARTRGAHYGPGS
jgi:hypothetical protein